MAYLTKVEVEARWKTLAAQIEAKAISEESVAKWIDDASATIDGYIGARYTLPLASTPPLIKTLAYQLFEYFWQKDVNAPARSGEEVTWLYARYDRAIDSLKKIQAGKKPLIDNLGNVMQPSDVRVSAITSNHEDVDQIFTMDDAQDQGIDTNYDSEYDGR